MMLTQSEGWPLDIERCPADRDLLLWLQTNKIEGASLFHMGPGNHHLVGRTCATLGKNAVLAITNCREEAEAYNQWAEENPALTTLYRCWFGDIHTLGARLLPQLDIVSLFHLGEITDNDGQPFGMSYEGIVSRFASRLIFRGGHLLFYLGSYGFPKLQSVIEPMLESWESEQFASLLVLRRKA